MVDWSKPYEKTDTEFDTGIFGDPWKRSPELPPLACKHCGENIWHHWQTADHRIWCVRNVAGEDSSRG